MLPSLNLRFNKYMYQGVEGQTSPSCFVIHKERFKALMASRTDLVVKVRLGQEVRRLPLAQDEQFDTLNVKVSST